MLNPLLYILSFNGLEIFQKIEFSQWVRCVSTADLTKNGKSEIIIGLGDDTLRIFKFDEETMKFIEFCSETFESFVNSCAVADLNGDSNLEIIAGSWDKTLRVFSLTETGLEELWRKELPYRIQSVKIADVLWNNRLEIVVLFNHIFTIEFFLNCFCYIKVNSPVICTVNPGAYVKVYTAVCKFRNNNLRSRIF